MRKAQLAAGPPVAAPSARVRRTASRRRRSVSMEDDALDAALLDAGLANV